MESRGKWSREWNSSTDPSKQRNYRENAPLHVKDKLVSANLDPELREELGTRSIPIRVGDRVRVMRGDESGEEGIVNGVDRRKERVFVNGIDNEKQDGSTREKALRPSNLQVTALNIDDENRLAKYEVADVEAIGVEAEEMEEALEEDEESEMMQQMQKGEDRTGDEEEETEEESDDEEGAEEVEGTEDEDLSTEEADEEEDAGTGDTDYSELVSGTVGESKDALEAAENVDWDAALEAEKDGKNRKTLIEWIERRTDG